SFQSGRKCGRSGRDPGTNPAAASSPRSREPQQRKAARTSSPTPRPRHCGVGLADHHRHRTPGGMLLRPSPTWHDQGSGVGKALANTLFATPLQSMDALAKPYAAGKSLQSGGGPDGVIGSVVPPGWMMMRMTCASVLKTIGSLGQVKP